MPVASLDDIAGTQSKANVASLSDIADSSDKPSLVSDAVKYSPIGMVKGLADMIRTAGSGKNPFAGMPTANAKILDKAKQSFADGHYADAAVHFANYLNPFGGAFEDVSKDLEDGNYGHAAAKFAGLTSSVVAGAKAPAVLDAATEPGAGAAIANHVKAASGDILAGGAKVLGGELLAKLPGMEFPARIGMGYPGARQMAKGVGKLFTGTDAPLATKVATATAAAEAEATDPLLDAIAQGQGYPKGFKSVPASGQQIVRNLADGMRAAEAKASAAPTPAPEAPAVTVPAESGESAASAPAPVTQTDLSPHLPNHGAAMDSFDNQPVLWQPGPAGTPEPWVPFSQVPDARATLPPELVAKVDAIQAAKGGPSIAEQLRDEMLANGTITKEHLAPPPEPEAVTPEGKAALADTMRALPSNARVPVANATYAGGAVDDSELAGAVYEAAHRADKASKLAHVLLQHGITSEEMADIQPEHWQGLSKSMGINPPSMETIAETIRQAQQVENHAALVDAMDRLGKSLQMKPEETK